MSRKQDQAQEREKSKNMGALRGLMPFLWPYRWRILGVLAALVLTAGISLSIPIAVRRVVDGFGSANLVLMDKYFAAAFGLSALLALGTAMRYYLVTSLGERVVADIRRALYDRVITMSPSFFEKTLTGEVISRITTDTTIVLSVIGSSVSVALRNLLMLIGGMILMFGTSAKLTGLTLLLVPLIILPILFLGRKLRVLSRLNQDRIALTSAEASESLLAAQTIQANTHEIASQKRFGQMVEDVFDTSMDRIQTRTLMTAMMIFFVFGGVVGVLWIGAADVREGVISAGVLVQFVIYAVLVAGAFASLSEIYGELQRAAGATERMIELLNARDALSDPKEPKRLKTPVEGRLDFRDVSFSYPARPDTQALKKFSLEINPGKTVAFVGPSGAGKTTVFQLIQRFFDPDTGAICLDGLDLRDMERGAFRQHISVVPQEPVIFAASIRENIRFGKPEASDQEIEAAAKAAAIDEFISDLPEGYDSYVGERGIMLSGGQKQRIAIARAILRNTPLLLLDEATSALDSASEKAIQLAVDELTKNRTTLVIAHRLATVKKADVIVVLENGEIVAMGRHDELVAQNGLYAKLAKLQFTDQSDHIAAQ